MVSVRKLKVPVSEGNERHAIVVVYDESGSRCSSRNPFRVIQSSMLFLFAQNLAIRSLQTYRRAVRNEGKCVWTNEYACWRGSRTAPRSPLWKVAVPLLWERDVVLY